MKFIATIAILLMGYAATAQSTSLPVFDSVTDAGTTVLSLPSANYFSGTDGTFSIGVVYKKGTGTPAGTIIVQGKIGGNVWTPLTRTSVDSFTITNVDSNHKMFFYDGKKVKDVRVQIVGSGTQKTRVEAYFIKNL